MVDDEDKYGRGASFARKTSRPQLMRALSDFEGKTIRRRYVCLGLFVLVGLMASIVIYGIVHAASYDSDHPTNSTETPEGGPSSHNNVVTSVVPDSGEPSGKEEGGNSTTVEETMQTAEISDAAATPPEEITETTTKLTTTHSTHESTSTNVTVLHNNLTTLTTALSS
ncbi:uncharacterized protein LOC132197221 [Neocloeon triangulifer]|uniref:uncharacterized protein LOC132197221 n=1 Tax=Neocloeon triangulifer TaxID=2078957 RepID=UPI00286F8C71|nr:uncharacterized protein LOC132197221 [Neocloeon triangulifer]